MAKTIYLASYDKKVKNIAGSQKYVGLCPVEVVLVRKTGVLYLVVTTNQGGNRGEAVE